MLICSHSSSACRIPDCHCNTGRFTLRDGTLVQNCDASIHRSRENLAVRTLRILVDHCHIEGEYLLWVRHSLNYTLKILAQQCLYLSPDPTHSLIRARIRLLQLQIDFYIRLGVVRLRAEFGLRRTLERGDHLSAPKSVAELQLTIRIEGQWVDSEATKLRLGGHGSYGFAEGHRDLELVIVVVGASFESVKADDLHICSRLLGRVYLLAHFQLLFYKN